MEENLNEINEVDEEIDVENQVFTYQDVQDIIQQVLPKVEMDLDGITGINIDKEQYISGVKVASYWCGFYNSMKSMGCSEDTILQMMLNHDTGNINIKQQEVVNKGQAEVAKYQQIQTMQNSI